MTMAESTISSSSESEDEHNEPYTPFRAEMSDYAEDVTGADILNHPPSDSESDTEVEPHSVYNIMKPFHIPGTGSGLGIPGNNAPESGLTSQGSEFSIIDNTTELVESSENQTRVTEETDDKTLMDDTGVGPSLTMDYEPEKVTTMSDQSKEEHDEQIEAVTGDAEDAGTKTKQRDRKPPQPPPKPVFKVVDDRKIIVSSESQTISSSENIDSYQGSNTEKDMTTSSDKQCEETIRKSSEVYENMTGDEDVKEVLEIKEAELTEQPGEDGQNDEVHSEEHCERREDIITDSMLTDSTIKDISDCQTCSVHFESFAIVGDNEDDDDCFSTPKEQMSEVEEEEPEAEHEPDPVTPDCEPKSASSSSSGADKSFVVIGKGTFKDSGSGYTSISSSVSESELIKSGERFGSEAENQEKGEPEKSDNILPFGDRIKLFEELSKEESFKTMEKTIETSKFMAGNDRNSPVCDGDEERDSEQRTTVHEEENTEEINLTSHEREQREREAVHEEENTEEINLISHESEDMDTASVNIEEEKVPERDTDDRPPVPPKSDAVLESLRSIPQEPYTTQEDQRFSERISEPQDRFHSHSGSESDIHIVEQGQERMEGMPHHSAMPGHASIPHSQLDPTIPNNQWGYFPQYPSGYYPGNQPFSMNPEMYQRMMSDPMYMHFVPYLQFMFQQQMLARQVPNANQSASFADACDSYQTQRPDTYQGPVYGPEPGSVPTVAKQQQMTAEHVQHDQAPPSYSSHADYMTHSQEASESLSTLKEAQTPSKEEDGRKELERDSQVHNIEELKNTQETKHQGPPIPKPRKRIVQKTPKPKSIVHDATPSEKPKMATEKPKMAAEKPKMATEKPKMATEKPKMAAEKPKMTFEKPKMTSKPRGFPQQPKIHPSEQKEYGRFHAEKSRESTTKLQPKTGLSHEKTTERTEPKHEETLLFVKNINPTTSTENLENFLEGGVGKHAEVKENSAILQSRDRTEALVTFTGKPDLTELTKRCRAKTLDDHHVIFCEVEAPTRIAVSSDDDIQSMEAVSLYFESKKIGGDLATEEVLESSDASCKIIQFKSTEVVKHLCSGERCHTVAGVKLKVSPYYRCELGEIWDTSLHNIRLPTSYTVPFSKLKPHFLARQCCNELKEDLSSKFADMDITESGIKITCTLTQRTPNCKSLAKTWTTDVKGAVDVFVDKLLEKTVEVKNHIWKGVCDFLVEGELEKDTLLIEKQDNKVYLYGMKTEVEAADDRLNQVMLDIDRKVRRKSETVTFKSPAIVKLLQSMGTFVEIEEKFTDLTITPEKPQVRIDGVPEDITKAKLEIHEANAHVVNENMPHDFSKELVRFVNEIERENKVLQKFKEELKDNNILAEIEITLKDCKIFVPPGKNCLEVKNMLFDLVCEEKIQLENESMKVLEEQIWDDMNEDLIERYEDTVDITANEIDQVVSIVGLKEFVYQAKDKLHRFFEENTIKSEIIAMDPFTQKFTKKYNKDKVVELGTKLSEHKVTIQLEDKDILVKATKRGLQLAKQELKAMFAKICCKDHTLKKVGVTEAMGNITMQLNEIETKTRCLIETPFMTESIYSPQQYGHMEASGGATWQGLEEEDDMPQTSSSVDEAPGFTAKNGVKVLLVKGEIGKQEASVIVCTTSPTLNLGSGAAGKSLLREGGHSLQDECKGIIAKKESIKHGEIVAISGGKIECKNIYLTVLPSWKDDSSSLQVLEDIMRDCLQKASKDGCFSILFCALGTGGLKYPAEEVAAVMYSKVIEFDTANPDTMLKEVKFVLYPKDMTSIQAFEKEERLLRFGGEKITYDTKFNNTTVTLVTEQLATQKVDCILCTTNKDMNLTASGACNALLTAGGQSLMDECKNKYSNSLKEGEVAEIGAGKLKCKSVYLTVLPPYTAEAEPILKDVVKTTFGLAQAKKYRSLACIALGTGYLKYPQAVVAKCMYTAVEDFVARNPSTCLQQIKFVMHAKDTKTIEAFRAYVRKGKVSTTRKSRTLDIEQPGKREKISRDYNAFSDGCQIRNITLKVITGDILEQNTDGIVNSVTEDFKFFGGVATALKKRCPGLESECQRKALKKKHRGVTSTQSSKHGGNLKADYIIHIAFQKSLDKWRSNLRKCLETAEKKRLKSLSIPVLGTGTGQHTFKPEEITACLFDAVDEFSSTQKPPPCLRELRFVVFHKQRFMMEPVIRSLHIKTQNAVASHQQKGSGVMSKLKGLKTAATALFGASKDSPETKEKHTIKRDEISTINLKIYSDDKKNIDVCIKEIENAVELEYTDYTLSDYKELIKDLNKEEMTKLEESVGVVDLKIDQTGGVIRITGPRKFVLDAQTNLHNCLKGFERIRQQTEEAETLYQLIQWQYEEVTNEGIELIPYTKLTNLRIENAYKNKQPSLELFDKHTNVTYVVDFLSLEEYEKTNKENSTVVVRKDILKSAKHALPPEWIAMKDDENIRIVNIGSSDPIYQQIEKQFVSEVKSGQYNNRISSIKNVKVTKIDRIQNKALYWQYMAKKELMMKQTPNPPKQFPIERKVWHGTSHVAVSSIQVHGFNRSYAGDKNGEPWFGHGVYFAGDASYSARSWLSGANSAGDGTTKGYIFLVNALTGEFCKGTKGMRYLPPKNPANPTVLYDCAVDDPAKPVEFVIFHDAQAYPEYLITFVS